jgi:hypothetical protein
MKAARYKFDKHQSLRSKMISVMAWANRMMVEELGASNGEVAEFLEGWAHSMRAVEERRSRTAAYHKMLSGTGDC